MVSVPYKRCWILYFTITLQSAASFGKLWLVIFGYRLRVRVRIRVRVRVRVRARRTLTVGTGASNIAFKSLWRHSAPFMWDTYPFYRQFCQRPSFDDNWWAICAKIAPCGTAWRFLHNKHKLAPNGYWETFFVLTYLKHSLYHFILMQHKPRTGYFKWVKYAVAYIKYNT